MHDERNATMRQNRTTPRYATCVLYVLATTLTLACSQGAPTAPSSAARPEAISSSARITPGTPPDPIAPLLARLNLVTNHLESANHQLDLFLTPPSPIVPPDPIHPQNALDFYLKANGVLGDLVPPDPIVPQWTSALNGIIGEANITLSLVNPPCDSCTPPDPIFQDIAAQANQTKALATALMHSPTF